MPLSKYINKMGVELEGAWYNAEPLHLTMDGSVRVRGDYSGESVSPPFASWSDLVQYVRENYPEEMDGSCGLHVHFSFNRISDYSRMMDKAFQPFFRAELKRWGERREIKTRNFWHRLNGENQFCRPDWLADAQARFKNKRDTNGQRYCQWNFCYGAHKTAECRVLPMFHRVEDSIAAIGAVRRTVGLWLSSQPDKLTLPKLELDDTEVLAEERPSMVTEEMTDDKTLVYKDEICV